MGIRNVRFSFELDRSSPKSYLDQVRRALKKRLKPGQEPLRYAIVSVSGKRAFVEASVLDKEGLA